MKRLSITVKITIWYTLFLVLLAGAMVIFLIRALAAQEQSVAERELVEIITDVSEKIENSADDFIYDKDIRFYEKDTYISIYNSEGELIVGRRPASVADFPDLEDKTGVAISDTQGTEWYIYDSLFQTNENQIWIRGMMRHVGHSKAGAFLVRFLLIAVPVFIFFAILGGLLITRRAFQPLRDIIRTTDEIRSDADVSRRVPLGDEQNEFHELTCSINAMFDTIEKSMAREQRFASDVSHELRTPIAVIQSQSEYALEDKAYREQALTVINKQARQMNNLVSRLLTLTRSDAGTLRPENEIIDMSELLTDICEQQQVVSSEEDIELTARIEENIFVNTDEGMLIRVILNLISNAIRYGKTPVPEGSPSPSPAGRITVSLRRENDSVFCTVADQGPGIPEDMHSRIWDRFFQADPSRSRSETAGLGLSIVQALTKAMGGSVSLVSREGEGAAFTVILPAAEVSQALLENLQPLKNHPFSR